MTILLDMKVPGRPVPWSRTTSYHGKRITPKKMRNWERVVKTLAALQKKCRAPVTCDVELTCKFYFSQKNYGDVSNLVKLIEDAMQGVIYVNDKQISRILAQRIMVQCKEEECTEVKVEGGGCE